MPVDYLLRFLEWTRRLTEIVARREGGRLPDALEEIEELCVGVTGLPFSLVRHNSPEALVDLVNLGTEADQKCFFLADLLVEYAKICEAEGNTRDQIGSYLQAYGLLRSARGKLLPEQEAAGQAKMNFLAQKLSVYKDDPYIQERLES